MAGGAALLIGQTIGIVVNSYLTLVLIAALMTYYLGNTSAIPASKPAEQGPVAPTA